MKLFFFVFAILSLLFGLAAFAGSKGAMHEIEAGIAFLMFAVSLFFGKAIGMMEEIIEKLGKKQE